MDRLRDLLRRLVGPRTVLAPGLDTIPIGTVSPKVLMIVHNPPIASRGGKRLTEVFGWHDPTALAQGFVSDIRECSGGYVNYQIVDRIDSDEFTTFQDGFRYDEESYLRDWSARTPHQPHAIDYEEQLRRFDLLARSDRDEFDEVWFFNYPFSGDYESTMAGPGAFWCNSPPVPNSHSCRRRFVMMGFNFERGVDCMLENFGHRTESIMTRVYEQLGWGENRWQQFIRYDKVAPGQAECGNVHFAPNSEHDYDWGNPRSVSSYCDDWLTYPDLPRRARQVSKADWGNGDMRAHHIWWLSHLPKVAGVTDNVNNNWWTYILDPNLVP
jgi:hypothetical protein